MAGLDRSGDAAVSGTIVPKFQKEGAEAGCETTDAVREDQAQDKRLQADRQSQILVEDQHVPWEGTEDSAPPLKDPVEENEWLTLA